MSILCRIFGHKLPRRYDGNAPWLQYTGDMRVDSLGTCHLVLDVRCPRCGDRYTVGHLQLPVYWMIEPTRPVPESRRISDLLAANNAEVERRRDAEAKLRTSREISHLFATGLIEIAETRLPGTFCATDSRVQRAKLFLELSKHDG